MQKNSRLLTVLHLCSFLVLLYSLSMPLPVIIGLVFGETDLSAFLITFVLAFSVGLLGCLGTSKANKTLHTRDGFLVVVLFWLIFCVISMLPFFFSIHACSFP